MICGRGLRLVCDPVWRRGNTLRCVAATGLLAGAPAAAGTPEDAMAAYRTARGAFDALDAPVASGIESPGAAVTVRVGGVVAGYASVYAPGGGAFDEALSLALGDFLQSDLAPRDATRRDRLSDLAAAALVQVELADALTPVDGATFAETALSFSPGLDGAAARRGDAVEAVFPDRMLAAEISPSQALTACVAALGLPAQPLEEARELSGVRVFRFRALSVGQVEAGGSAVFLHRSGRVRPLTSVVGSRLEEFGSRLNAALVKRVWSHEGVTRLLGTYDPVKDSHDPLIAPAEDHAVAALALARWGQTMGDARASDLAGVLLESLSEEELDARSAGLALLALDVLGEGNGAFAGECVRALAGVEDSSSLSDRAIAAAAKAGRDRAGALELLQGVLSEAGRGGAVGAAPWIVWAARDLAQDDRVPGAAALREGRDLIWEHQITRTDAGADEADLAGGIVFSASRQPLPTAQSARAAAMAAAMQGVPGLTPEAERPGQLAKLLPTLRFLRQLSVEEAEARLYADPGQAEGGVRLALWDHRQPVEATALSLIAVTETLEAAR